MDDYIADCPICLDTCITPVIIHNCGHRVCGPCIEEWQKTTKHCPLCRYTFSDYTLVVGDRDLALRQATPEQLKVDKIFMTKYHKKRRGNFFNKLARFFDTSDYLNLPNLDQNQMNSLTCRKCLDIYIVPVIIHGCGHKFCGPCAKRSLDTDGKCPQCRSSFEYSDFTIIIDDRELVLRHATPTERQANAKFLTDLSLELRRQNELQRLQTWLSELSIFRCFSLKELNRMTTLSLSWMNIDSIPIEIRTLNNLKHLHLIGAKFRSFPSSIGQLTNLTSLDIHDNRLTELPAELGQLINLDFLDLGRNQISQVPSVIGHLTKLKILILEYNQIRFISSAIAKLAKLKYLELSHNQLTRFPIGICHLDRLKRLELAHNRIVQIPSEIGQLNNLVCFNLSDNQISNLPAEFSELDELYSLDLSHNLISKRPRVLSQLPELKQLDLHDNRIKNPRDYRVF